MDVLSNWLELASTFLTANLLPAAVLLALGILVIRLIMRVVEKLLQKAKLEKAATGLIKTVIRVILYGLVGLTAASKLGIDITGVVALASVLTLAISLSVQDALTNLISGFTLLYTKPFVAGDYVEIAGQGGTVQEIGLTYTKLSTPDNKMISLPNSSVTSAQIVNYTVTGTRRVDITVSASYDSPVQLVLDTLKEAATVPTVLDSQPVFVALNSYGDSAIGYVVRVWSTTENYWDTYFTITENIKKAFDEKGIEMTYPHLNVHVHK